MTTPTQYDADPRRPLLPRKHARSPRRATTRRNTMRPNVVVEQVFWKFWLPQLGLAPVLLANLKKLRSSLDIYTISSIMVALTAWSSVSMGIFFSFPREIRDTIYACFWDDQNILRNIRMSMNPAPDCFPCYHAGYSADRAPWFCRSFGLGPLWGNMVQDVGGRAFEMYQEIALSFYENFMRFEMESLRDLQTFFNHEFFGGSGKAPKHALLKGLMVRICFGKSHGEFFDLDEVSRYLASLHEARLSAKNFKIHIHLWVRYEIRRLRGICPTVNCALRRANEGMVEEMIEALEYVNSFRSGFENEKRHVKVSVGIEGQKKEGDLCFVVPLSHSNDVKGWLSLMRRESRILRKRQNASGAD